MIDNEENQKRLRDASAPAEASSFVQPKITGYRQLNATEAALMNEVKALEAACGDLVKRLRKHPDITAPPTDSDRLPVMDQRAVSIAVTELQTGFMWLVRGIARPADPFK